MAVRADDTTIDDEYLGFLTEAAGKHVLTMTNRTVDDLMSMGDGTLPEPITQAILLLVGHWYNQRESVSGMQMYEVPMGVEALVKPYRRLV